MFFDLVLDFSVELGMVGLEGSFFLRSSLSVIKVATLVGTAGTMFMILPEGINFFAASVRVWLKNFSPFRGQVGISAFANLFSVKAVKFSQSALL